MAQKKKKKRPSQHQHNSRKYLLSKASYDHARAITGKVLRAYGFAPNLFDSFPRIQRIHLFYPRVEPLRIKVEEGQRIPRQLVTFVSESANHFLRTYYFGDKSIGLSFLELSTYGMSLACVLEVAETSGLFRPSQHELIASVAKKINQKRVVKDLLAVTSYIRTMMLMISKVNLRIYGYNWKIQVAGESSTDIRSTVYLSSEAPVSIRFTHEKKEQTAFRVRAGRLISKPAHNATIDRRFLFGREEPPAVHLSIYIRPYALRRAGAWIDIFRAHRRNYYLMESLLYMQRVENSLSERPMLVCYFKEKHRIVYLGYYSFIIRGDNLIILDFLPLTFINSSAGVVLSTSLGLQAEDIAFLGMDKLSFFLTVDFDQIPVLKKALTITNIWSLVRYAANNQELKEEFSIDEKKTQMVKQFFENRIPPETDTPKG
jgi:hypothetical protein